MVCGQSNPFGLGLKFVCEEDGSVAATFLGHPALEGFQGFLHGGMIASLLEGAMTNCLFAHGCVAMTGELNVRYREPVVIGEEMRIRGWIKRSSAASAFVGGGIETGRSRQSRRHGQIRGADMSGEIRITVLVENSVNTRGLRAEHGLAFLIQTERHQLLFDTGQSDLVIQNARQLQLDLRDLEAVVLSHGHYDHTGGLKAVNGMAPRARFYLHPAALSPKFAGQSDGTSRAVGMNEENVKVVREAARSVTWTHSPTEVVEGIFVTGEIPRQNNFEDTGGRFFLDEACSQPDPLVDDQALFFDTREGLVVRAGVWTCGRGEHA